MYNTTATDKESTPLVYSNLRTSFDVDNWPSGKYKTRAIFKVEYDNRQRERVIRITYHPTKGFPNAPKRTTYARKVRIADGSDGKTYLLEWTGTHISVMRATMDIQEESLHENNPRFPEIYQLLMQS